MGETLAMTLYAGADAAHITDVGANAVDHLLRSSTVSGRAVGVGNATQVVTNGGAVAHLQRVGDQRMAN